MLNTDSRHYAGSDVGNIGAVEATAEPWQGQEHSAPVTLPPLGVVWFTPAAGDVCRDPAAGYA